MDEIRSVAIIGAGPAGVAAAIYLQRAGFEPLLLEEDAPGGLLRRAGVAENYPGFPEGIAATDLADLFCEHLRTVGGSVTKASVERISIGEDGTNIISTTTGEHRSNAVIVATGTKAKRIDVEGSRDVEGHEVFYDILKLLDEAKPREKIAIYGGGDAAFDRGLNLSQRGHEIVIICRSTTRCLPLLKERADQRGIQVVEGRSIVRLMDGKRFGLELEGAENIDADRLLIACGREPRLDIMDAPLAAPGRPGDQADVFAPGIYLAGDVMADGRRQVGIAVGSGLTAAMMAEQYLRKLST